jgi:histidyl-tRNA synthetase
MVNKGISDAEANKYFEAVQNIKPDETIKTIVTYLEESGFGKEFYRFEPTLARSFSYSQGPIWELVIEDYTVGSVGGGERYDGMMNRLTGVQMPATGMAYGFDRTVEAAAELGLIPDFSTKTKALVTIFSSNLQGYTLKIAASLRASGINIELYPDPTAKMEKQFKYADKKGIPYAIVIGEEEVSKNIVTLKNLSDRTQSSLPIEEVVKLLSN